MNGYDKMCLLAEASNTKVVPTNAFLCFGFEMTDRSGNRRLITSVPDADGNTTEVFFSMGVFTDDGRLMNGICASTRARFHTFAQELTLLVGALEQALGYHTGLTVEVEALPSDIEKLTIRRIDFPADAEESTIAVVTEFYYDGYIIR